MKTMIICLVFGFVWGLAVSVFNNYWAAKAFGNGTHRNKGSIIFSVRQLINIIAMFLVYKNVAMLIGTALGLTAVKNYILLKTVCSLKGKGVS